MRRIALCGLTVLVLAYGCGPRLSAMDLPYRPIPEIPSLLWHTEFDESPDMAKKLFEKGTIKTGKPNAEGDSMIALGASGPKATEAECSIQIGTTPARFPDKLNPNQIYLLFNIWSNEPGKVEVTARAGVEASDLLTLPKTGIWCTMKVSLGAMSGRGGRIKPDAITSTIRLKFRPTRTEKAPEVYVDKFLVCYQMPPEQVALILGAWQAKMSQLRKSVQTDGFCYDEQMHAAMQRMKQQSNHRGPALVMLPLPADKTDAEAGWTAAAQESKMRGVKFEIAQDPRGLPLAGLAETRAFLPYLLDKTDAQSVMLVITRDEAMQTANAAEVLRMIVTRLQNAHCAPFVCLPADEDGNKKLKDFLTAGIKLCDELSVPYVDQGFAFKNVKAPFADGCLTPEGEVALRTLLVAGYKHVYSALDPRR